MANEGGVVEYGSWGLRFGAWVVDQIVLLQAVVYLVFVPVAIVADEAATEGVGFLVGAFYPLFLIVYFTGFHGRLGQTLGKRVFRLRVVDESASRPIGYGRALGRSVATAIFWALFPLGLIDGLRPLWNDRRQSWHDSVARSVVVCT